MDAAALLAFVCALFAWDLWCFVRALVLSGAPTGFVCAVVTAVLLLAPTCVLSIVEPDGGLAVLGLDIVEVAPPLG